MRYLILVAFSIQALFLIPMLVGVLAENLAFTESQLGGIAAADLAGFSAASLWVFVRANRLDWQRLIVASTIAVIVANLLCTVIGSFWGLFSLRVLAGFGAGIAYSIAIIAIARRANATSLFGWSMAAQGLVAMVALAALPHLLNQFGMPVLFWLLSLMALICLTVVPGVLALDSLPNDTHRARSVPSNSSALYLPRVIVFGGIFALYLGQGGFTAFIERIGADNGIDNTFIGYSLAASSFAGVVAGVIAGLQAKKIGLRMPLLIVFVGQLFAIWLLWQSPANYWGYLLVLVIYNFCWVYVVPFHMSIVANQDSNGRLVALAPAIQGGGLAVGAAMTGGLLESSTGYDSLYLFIILTGLCGLLLVSWIAVDRRQAIGELPEGVL